MASLNKILLPIVGPKRKAAFLVLFFVIFAALLAPRPAFAAWYDFLIGAFTFIPFIMVSVVLALGVLLSNGLAYFSGVVLKWVLDPQFIQLSYTNPANNQIIQIGLNITQPLANMILVLVLVFIAVATILRLAGYETKKLLPTFIIIALLVNFSPVILGLIVDAANIVMNFFIEEITGGDRFWSQLKALGDRYYAAMGNLNVFSATGQTELVVELIVFTWINLALFANLLLWATLFISRYVAIWLLVILSPIAFVCYILPATRRIWSLWWHQFTSWVIVGVNAVFFLYLADQFATLTPFGVAPGTLGGALLPTLFPLAVYWAGLIISVGKLPAEAAAIRAVTQRGGRWVRTKAWTGLRRMAEEKLQTREMVGAALRGKYGLLNIPTKYGGGLVRTFLPETVKRYPEFRPAIDAAETDLSKFSSPELARQVDSGELYGVRAAAALKILAQRGDMQDFFGRSATRYAKEIADLKAKTPGLTTEDALYQTTALRDKTGRLLEVALKGGYHNEILRSDPRMARFAYNRVKGYFDQDLKKDDFDASIYGAVAKASSESRERHFTQMEREVMEDKVFVETLMERGEDAFRAVGRSVKRAQPTTQKTIDTLYSEFIDRERKQGKTYANDTAGWEAYRDDFKNRHKDREGFFVYAGTNVGKRQGWREGRYLTKEEREEKKEAPGAPPSTPGAQPPGPDTTPPPGGVGGRPPGTPPTTPGAATGVASPLPPTPPPTPPRGRPVVGNTPFEEAIRQKQARGETLSEYEKRYLMSSKRRQRPRGRPGPGGA